MKVVVIGGNGLIGKKVVTNLRRRGHEAVAASRSSGVDTVTGEGLAGALAGAAVVVDVSNAPSWEDAAVLAFFETSSRNLLSAEAAAAVADAALAEPLNGTVDLAGPEAIRQDELVRRFLVATGDARTVVADPQSLYFGLTVDDRSLTPGDNPRLGTTRFADWLAQSQR
jgi:uncharacterized protein YbjT (DUF2867 family)